MLFPKLIKNYFQKLFFIINLEKVAKQALKLPLNKMQIWRNKQRRKWITSKFIITNIGAKCNFFGDELAISGKFFIHYHTNFSEAAGEEGMSVYKGQHF